jgi:PHD/YefM family antitoxin component YafN of YafNO toxin-antitoxin module
MIELTEQQRQELSGPEPVAIDPQTNEEYVLVRKQTYERMKELLYDDSPWTDEERDLLRAETVEMLDHYGKNQ